MSPLGLLGRGEVAEIVSLRPGRRPAEMPADRGHCHGSCHQARGRRNEKRLADMGFAPGQVIEVVENSPAMPLLLKVCDSRIAVDRGVAMQIIVRRICK